MNKLKLFLAAIILLVSVPALSQSDKEMEKDRKKVDKAIKVFRKKSYSKGIEKLRKHMNNQYGKGLPGLPSLYSYETLVAMEYLSYDRKVKIINDLEDIFLEEEDVDSADMELIEDLKTTAKKYFINVCRSATMESQSYTADTYLRSYLVDYDPDTLISEKAKEYFEEGEEFFFKEDYELAELNYRKALYEDSTYYKALLYLGDSFWAREDYDSAIVYYSKAKAQHPTLLEPRKYIVDALMEQGLYYRAKKECIEAFTVYAGFDMKLRLQKILKVENKYMNDHRFIRYFYPNNMKNEDQGDLNDPIWDTYRATKDKIGRYCNEDGIIESNGMTDDKYLEVYSIRRLLEEHEEDLPKYMKFGYKMMEEDYLEPYIFISLFHVDIHPQFKDYMSVEENRVKSMEYVEKYLIESY